MPGITPNKDNDVVNSMVIPRDGKNECEICGKSFALKTSAKSHIRKYHQEEILYRSGPNEADLPVFPPAIEITGSNPDARRCTLPQNSPSLDALTVARSMRCGFRLTNSCILRMCRYNKLGVDLGKIKNPKDVLEIPSEAGVECLTYCTGCTEAVVEACINPICMEMDTDVRQLGRANIAYQLKRVLESPTGDFGPNFELNPTIITDIKDGEMYRRLKENCLQADAQVDWYVLMLNTDGVSLYQKPPSSFWPLFLVVCELLPNKRFIQRNVVLHSLYQGDHNVPFRLIFTDLQNQLTAINHSGGLELSATSGNRRAKFVIGPVTLDLMARAPISGMQGPTSYTACIFCEVKGESVATEGGGNVRGFTVVQEGTATAPFRSDESFAYGVQIASERNKPYKGIEKNPPILALTDIILPWSFVVDSMHGLYLGIAKLLTSLWTATSSHKMPYYLKRRLRTEISTRLARLFAPSFVTRCTKRLDTENWKANEWRSWVLYYSIPVLKDILPDSYYAHWCCFVEICHIISGGTITAYDLDRLGSLIPKFVGDFANFYGSRYMNLNVHNLTHLISIIKNWGPVWAYSCFNFEHLNGWMRRRCFGTGSIIILAAKRYLQAQDLAKDIPRIRNPKVRKLCFQDMCIPVKRMDHYKNVHVFDKSRVFFRDPTLLPHVTAVLTECASEHRNNYTSVKRIWLRGFVLWTPKYTRPLRKQGNFISVDMCTGMIFGKILSIVTCPSCRKVVMIYNNLGAACPFERGYRSVMTLRNQPRNAIEAVDVDNFRIIPAARFEVDGQVSFVLPPNANEHD